MKNVIVLMFVMVLLASAVVIAEIREGDVAFGDRGDRPFYYGGDWQDAKPPKGQEFGYFTPGDNTFTIVNGDNTFGESFRVDASAATGRSYSVSSITGGALDGVRKIVAGTLGISVKGATNVLAGGSRDGATVGGAAGESNKPYSETSAPATMGGGYSYVSLGGEYDGLVVVRNSAGEDIGYTTVSNARNLAGFGVRPNTDLTVTGGLYEDVNEAKRARDAHQTIVGGKAADTGKPGEKDSGYEVIQGKDGSITERNKDSGLITRRRYPLLVSGGEVTDSSSYVCSGGSCRIWRTDFFNEKDTEDDVQDGTLTHFTVDENGDGNADAVITFGDVGYSCEGACENTVIERYYHQQNWDHLMSAGQAGVAWSQLSSLFGMDEDFADWRLEVDKLFHDMFLGSDYWSEAICAAKEDVASGQDVMFSYNEEGILTQAASIYATKQFIQTPEGNQWLYRVSFFLRNPSRPTPTTSFGRGDSKSSGLVARDALNQGQALSNEERDVWNVIKKAGREISNERVRYSRTAKGEVEFDFNIEFRGQRTIALFTNDDRVDSGDEVTYTGDDSFAAYSSYDYGEVCIIFPGEKPIDAFYEGVDEVCASVVDVSDSAPTTIPVETDDRVETTRNGNFRVI